MKTTAAPLDHLAQRIAQQQSELEDLRREYESRQARLADLAHRKEALETQLRQVQAEIQAVARGATSTPTAKPAKALLASASARVLPAKAARPQTLAEFLLSVMGRAKSPLTVRQLADEVVRRKFPTASKNIPDLVKSEVRKLVAQGVLQRVKDQPGVTLVPANGKPKTTTVSPPTGGASKNGTMVAGYVRVSSQRQAVDGDSLTAQRHEIEREVESRKRWEDWEVQSLSFYVDAGKSAKDTNRPELQRLIRDIEAGSVNIVVCCNLDRITRSMKNFVELWELFDRHNVDVICLRQKFDTSTPNGKAMLRSMMVFAELERDMTAERTFSTMLDRADRGCWNGGHVLGYVSDPQERGKLIIDVEGAGIVRRIFNLFEELGSAEAVTRKLNDLGIRYPTYETRSGRGRGGKSFVKQKVIGILRNRIYLGEIRWGDLEPRTDCHEAILSPEQFDRVQHRLGQTRMRRQNLRQVKGRRYLLTGLLRCQCGAHLVGAAAHGRNGVYRYYVCTRQVHQGGKSNCNSPRIPADTLEFAVLERVRELGSVAEVRDRIVRRALDCIDSEARRIQEEEAAVRREAGRVKAEIGRLLEVLKTMGARVLPSIEGELARLEGLEAGFQKQLVELAARQVPMTRVAEDARRFVATWRDVGELLAQATPDEQHLILQHYIEVIELRATNLNGKTGTYAMRLFPEVRPHPKPGDEEGEAGARVPRQPTLLGTPSGAVAPGGNDLALLTEDGVVRTAV